MSTFRQTEEWYQAWLNKVANARLDAIKLRKRETGGGDKGKVVLKSLPRAIPKAGRHPQKRVGVSEHHEQVAVIAWWDMWGPANGYDRRLLFAIPNGEYRAWASAKRLKAEGARPGVPDLMLAVARGYDYAGLFIELKRRKGRATRDQLAYHDLLRSQGYRVEVCQGFEAARDAILRYLV